MFNEYYVEMFSLGQAVCVDAYLKVLTLLLVIRIRLVSREA